MRTLQRILIATVLLCLLAAGSARADTTNYWGTNTVGDLNGTMNGTANWSLGTPPFSTEQVWFTNQQAASSPYTNQLSGSITTGPLRVYDDSVVYDLNGYRWTVNDATAAGTAIDTNGSPFATTVKFSSSSITNAADGNVVNLAGVNNAIIGNNAKVVVDDSLGNPVKVIWPSPSFGLDGDLTVSGPGSEFQMSYVSTFGGLHNNTLVANGAVLSMSSSSYPLRLGTHGNNGWPGATATVDNATINSPGGTAVGWYFGLGWLDVRNGSTWYDGATVGVGNYYLSKGEATLDNSTLVGQILEIGDAVNLNAYGKFYIQNGASATFSNRALVAPNSPTQTNLLVLNNGTISLGGGSTAGVLTNFGTMRAAGTIRGQGSSPALVYGGPASMLEVGSSIGTLTLSNANLTLAAGSQTLWEFSDTGLDQINMVDGSASLLGTNLFSLAAGSAPLTPGVKWGLGTYDFVVGTNIIWNPQYADLTNLLNSAGLQQGLDYRFGFVDLGSYQALRLEFVPEPSTVLLLVGGGLLLFRLRRGFAVASAPKEKRIMKTQQRILIATVLLCLLAAGSARADTTNYWGTNTVGDLNGTMNGTVNWSLGTPPISTEQVWFTNQQAASSPYTNQLSGSITTGPLRVYDDSVVYDLNGYRWTVNDTGAGSFIDTNGASFATTVKFSSSSITNVADGNVVNVAGSTDGTMGNNAKVVVDDSLGNGVKVIWPSPSFGLNADLTVSGPGSEFQMSYVSTYGGLHGNTLVSSGAVLSTSSSAYILKVGGSQIYVSSPATSTCTVDSATINAPGGTSIAPYFGQGVLDVRNGSTWYDGAIVGVGNFYYGHAKVTLDNSTLIGQRMEVGDGFSGTTYSDINGEVHIQNGASATLSNSIFVAGSPTGFTNLLVLNNGTISLGGGSTAGVLTNFGTMRAAGTIRGQGSSPALVYVGSSGPGTGAFFEVGSSIGSLTLSDADLKLDVGSQTLWEFSDTGLDQINVVGGWASLDGTNLFALAAGSAVPTPGVKWGLGYYDFVLATGVTAGVNFYDNMTNLLSGYSLVENVDYRFGVFDLGGGLQALRLEFVPEPSTVMLLVGGGLVLWRFRRRKA